MTKRLGAVKCLINKVEMICRIRSIFLMLNVSCPQYCVSFCDKTCDVCVPTSLQYEVVAINFETTLIETSVCCSTVQATFAIANKNNSNQYNITSGSVI